MTGIANYTHCGPSTQPADFVDDARDIITQHYPIPKIILYKAILKKYGLKEESEKLHSSYKRLEEISKGNINSQNIY